MTSDILATINMTLKSTEVTESSEMGHPSAWNSLSHIEIILNLEKKFNIEIPLQHVADLISVKKIYEYIKDL